MYALGKHLARVDGVIGDDQKYWYVTDHLGSIRAVTDKNGKKVWSADYLAFGKQFGEEKNSDYPDFEELHSFTGKEYDPDTGLHYYNARWYDADLGRFISEDPVGANLVYGYCSNNPINRIDPTGCIDYSNEINWDDDLDGYRESNYLPGDPSPTVPDMDGGSEGSEGSTVGQTKPGPTIPEGPNGIATQGIIITEYSKNGYTQTIRGEDGKIQSKTVFDKDGNIKSQTVYNPDGTRTETKYTYTRDGIIVEQRDQSKGIFGGWTSKSIEITGYNSKKDLENKNAEFIMNDDGRVSTNQEIINGNLLARACNIYLDEFSPIEAGLRWFNLVATGGYWDFKNVHNLPNTIFNFDGKLFNAEQFGNINYGYTGGHLGLTFDIVIAGSVYANHGKIDQNELNDWPYISLGYYHTGSHESMENFRSKYSEWF